MDRAFCNLNIFLAHSRQYAIGGGSLARVHQTADIGRDVTFIGMGKVSIGLNATQPSWRSTTPAGRSKIVAEAGVEAAHRGQPGLDTPEKLKGKTLGTVQPIRWKCGPTTILKSRHRSRT